MYREPDADIWTDIQNKQAQLQYPLTATCDR